MTTRRTPPPAPGARSPCSEERVGRLGAAFGWSPLALGLGAGAVGALRGCRLLGLFLVELRAAGERAVRGVLVDRRGGGLDLDAGIGQPLQHLG